MAFDYVANRETVLSILNRYGGGGYVTVKGQSGGFSEGGDPIPDTPDTNILGTITPLMKYKKSEIDGSSILKGDAWVYFDADTIIEVNNQVTINGNSFRVMDNDTLRSINGEMFTQKLQLRG